MSNIDQEFVEFVIKSLVSHPDDVQIERTIDEKGVLLQLTVNPEDLGRVIGKRGATAQSVRTLLRALGTKNDARYNLKIVDNGVPREERMQQQSQQQDARPDVQEESAPASMVDSGAVVDMPGEVVEAEAPAEEVPAEDESNFAARHRAELAELDDLDI